MSAGSICSRVVATAWPTESVRVAARRMAKDDVGTVVVVEADGPDQAIGMLTDRDIVIRCVAGGLDPDATPVSKVMSTPVHAVDEHVSVEDAIAKMAGTATRRLVVTSRDRAAIGILSLDDVLDLLGEETRSIGRLLEKQKPRIPA
jgi:CBS domain-containing protein